LLRVRSLGGKVSMLAVGVSGLLALGLTALGYFKAAQGLRERSESALAAEARLATSLVDAWEGDREGGLRALTLRQSVRQVLEMAAAPAPEDMEAADQALADFAALKQDVDSIALVSLAGKVIRSSKESDQGRDLSQRADVREALEGRTSVTGVQISPATGQMALYLALPVKGSNGTVIGVIRVRSTLEGVQVFVTEAKGRAGAGAEGVLLDDQGLIVAATQGTRARMKAAKDLSVGLSDAVRATGLRVMHFPLGGTEHLAVAIPLRSMRWVYVATLPVSEVERSAREFLRTAALAAGAGLALAGLFSFLLARRVVRSVVRLTEISGRIVSEGDLTQLIDVISDDEVGQLAESFSAMVEALRGALTTLRGSAGTLEGAIGKLQQTVEEQTQFMSKQATSLQQTQVTAQEIKQTSVIAAEKAQQVLQVAERADEIGRAGEGAVGRTLGGLGEIGRQAAAVGEEIQRLRENARKIGGITLTVKDLADQSNMLALNAAIEAVRSGEHGKSFAVVAREIRSLADQSIRATSQVGEILGELTRSIGSAVSMTGQSTRRMEAGLTEVNASGDSLRELSGIARENVSAVRQIAAAVSQQNAGIAQIFAAVNDQMTMMDQVQKGLERTQGASAQLNAVAAQVADTLSRYKL
jgi:methyl-accepting chemotaxis protein